MWLRQLLPAGSRVWSPGTDGTAEGADTASAERAPKDPLANRNSTRGGAATEVGAGLRIGGLCGAKSKPPSSLQRGGSKRRMRRSAEKMGASRSGRHAANLVMACNSVQSNFMAPYDFLVVDGAAVRQNYTKVERPLTGTSCWVFQTSGAGSPRVVRIQLGDDDSLWHQAEAAHSSPWSDVTIRTGLSGLPILLDGVNVCGGINQRIQGTPMFPNTVTWNPQTTRAGFTAIGSIGSAKSFVICVSVVEGIPTIGICTAGLVRSRAFAALFFSFGLTTFGTYPPTNWLGTCSMYILSTCCGSPRSGGGAMET